LTSYKCEECGSLNTTTDQSETGFGGGVLEIECNSCGLCSVVEEIIDTERPRIIRHQYEVLGSKIGDHFDYSHVNNSERLAHSGDSDIGFAKEYLGISMRDDQNWKWELITGGSAQHPFFVTTTKQRDLKSNLGSQMEDTELDMQELRQLRDGENSAYASNERFDAVKVVTKIVSDDNREDKSGAQFWIDFGLLMHMQTENNCPWSLNHWIASVTQGIERDFENWFSNKGIVSRYTFEQIGQSNSIAGIDEGSKLDKNYFSMAIEGTFVHLHKFKLLLKPIIFSRELRSLSNDIIDSLSRDENSWHLSTFIKKVCTFSLGENKSPVNINSWKRNPSDAINCVLLSTPTLLTIASVLKYSGHERTTIDTILTLVANDCKYSQLGYKNTIKYWNELLKQNSLEREFLLPIPISD